MSILKSIKGTLKTVQDDFSEGLKSITGVPEKPPPHERIYNIKTNFDAGADLLHKNEIVWKDLYTYTEETGKQAQDVDVAIAKLLVRYEQQSEVLGRLHQEAANLPILLTQLQDITNALALVEEEYDKVESGLVHLENLCEEVEYRREVKSHHNQLAVYKMKKDHEIQKYKVQLAREHANKVQQIDDKRELRLKERQTAYEEQFSSDVDFYKKHGKLERLPSTPETEKKLDIGDVEIEEDPSALDSFLDSSASDPAISEPSEQTETNETSDVEETTMQILPVVTSPVQTDSSEVISPTSEESSDVTQSEQSVSDTCSEETNKENVEQTAQTDSDNKPVDDDDQNVNKDE